MPTDTPKHGLNRPDSGTLNWDTLLNENFDILDVDIEIRDTSGNRAGYTPSTGAKFIETDTGNVYLGDGASWNLQGHLSRRPNNSITIQTIADASNVAIPVRVPAGETMRLWVWGVRSSTQTTPAGLTAVFYDETAGAQVNAASTSYETGGPIASLDGGTTGKDATLRVNNATGGPIDAGGVFGYTIE